MYFLITLFVSIILLGHLECHPPEEGGVPSGVSVVSPLPGPPHPVSLLIQNYCSRVCPEAFVLF